MRFPSNWFADGRTPSMGQPLNEDATWSYIARFLVNGNESLNAIISNRKQPGRLLLHIVLRDTATWSVSQDIAIGCFHPLAKGVKEKAYPDKKHDLPHHDACVVWMAVRRTKQYEPNVFIDNFLLQDMRLEDISHPSPLGNRRYICNSNV